MKLVNYAISSNTLFLNTPQFDKKNMRADQKILRILLPSQNHFRQELVTGVRLWGKGSSILG
jgi:hypothetical protein